MVRARHFIPVGVDGLYSSIGVLNDEYLLSFQGSTSFLQSGQGLEECLRVRFSPDDIFGRNDGGEALEQFELIQNRFDFLPGGSRCDGQRHGGGEPPHKIDSRFNRGNAFLYGLKVVLGFQINEPANGLRIRFSLLVIQKVLEEIAVVVRKIVLAILLPAQAKPFLLESLLKSMEVRTFVVDQNAIEIKNNSPDLH